MTATTPPHVSVVIPTRNRGTKIGPAVDSVLACDHPSFDLTVVDQSDGEETREVVAEMTARDGRVAYVRMEGTGAARARNEGARRSSGEIVAFLDDDCTVDPSWISDMVKAFDDDPSVGMVYGQVHAAVDLTPALTWDELERMQRPGSFKVWGMSANFAMRRPSFDEVQGFDELLGVGAPLFAGEDFDLEYRVYRAGSAIVLTPDVSVLHHGYRAVEEWPSLTVNYGAGDAAFYLKHVRCWDVRVLVLMARRLTRVSGRWAVKSAIRRPAGNDWSYLMGFLRGVRTSVRYRIDKSTRLYIKR